MALDTVVDYVGAARTLLQDARVPYRYPDADLKQALGFAFMETRRLRPDLFLGVAVPNIIGTTGDATAVVCDVMYRTTMLNYVVARMKLREDEAQDKAEASAWMNTFRTQLLSLA